MNNKFFKWRWCLIVSICFPRSSGLFCWVPPFHSDVIFQFWNALLFCVKRLSKPQLALWFGAKAEINLTTIVFYFSWIKAFSRVVFMAAFVFQPHLTPLFCQRNRKNRWPIAWTRPAIYSVHCTSVIPTFKLVCWTRRQNGMLYANNATRPYKLSTRPASRS